MFQLRTFIVASYFTIFLSLGFAQDCRPEFIDQDKDFLSAGEYKGTKLLAKMKNLLKEILAVSRMTYSDESQRKAIEFCLVRKDDLFQELSKRADGSIRETADFHEVIGDYSSFHDQYREALVSYDRAIAIDHRSLELLKKDYDTYAIVENLKLNEIALEDTVAAESRKILEEAATRIQRIADHPDAQKSYAVAALKYRALIARGLQKTQQENEFWQKLLALDPKNELAARALFLNAIKATDTKSATEGFRRLSRNEQVKESDWQSLLKFLAIGGFYDEYLSWIKRAPANFTDKFPEYKSYLVRAYIEMGRPDEAMRLQKTLGKAPSPAAALLAAQNRSRLTELEGDNFRKQNRLSEALDAYKKALGDSPNPLTLKEKISLLIYDYRRGLNFEPFAATKKDLQEVVSLLEKSAFEKDLKASFFEVFLHSLQFTGNKALLAKACARYQSLYAELVSGKPFKQYCGGESAKGSKETPTRPILNPK